MPTYEKVGPDGVVEERSVTFADTPHDLQLSDAARNVDSPWFAVDEQGHAVKLPPLPVFIEPPAQHDDAADEPPPAPTPPPAAGEQHDEPAESGDDTEE